MYSKGNGVFIAAFFTFAFLFSNAATARCQTLKFEAAAIHPAIPGRIQQAAPAILRNHLGADSVSLRSLIVTAYGLQDFQIKGMPEWGDSEFFSIQAEASADATREQMLEMLRNFLLDRFALNAKTSQELLPVYSLEPTAGGAKLMTIAQAREAKVLFAKPPEGKATINCGTSTAALASTLNKMRSMDRPVMNDTAIDQTGLYLALIYDKPELGEGRDPSRPALEDSPKGNALVKLLEEQFGLTLVKKTEQVNVLVITNVARPTAN